MTLNDVLTDFAWLSILLLIGFQLRRKIKVLQRFFIPTSLIAGFLGMFFGPNWLGTVSPIYIPFTSALSQWSGVLVIFVCATMFLGLELGSVTRNGMAATFMGGLSHQVQLVTGLIVAAICGLFMSDLPYQFGFMGVWGFYAGHGNATTVGNIMQEAGFWDDAVGVGVTFATLGMLSGVIGGMILINIGAKKGLTHVKMSFDDMPEDERTGYIKPEDRRSIGNGVTNSSSIDPLAFQLAVIGLVVVIGILERTLLIKIHPVMSNFPLVGAGYLLVRNRHGHVRSSVRQSGYRPDADPGHGPHPGNQCISERVYFCNSGVCLADSIHDHRLPHYFYCANSNNCGLCSLAAIFLNRRQYFVWEEAKNRITHPKGRRIEFE